MVVEAGLHAGDFERRQFRADAEHVVSFIVVGDFYLRARLDRADVGGEIDDRRNDWETIVAGCVFPIACV
jgi:hypothetical protein